MKAFLPLVSAIFLFLSACASVPTDQERSPANEEAISWTELDGVETAVVSGGLRLVRVDLRRNAAILLNSPATTGSVARVAQREGLLVAINAAMYGKDHKTSIGYMRHYETVNNPKVSRNLQGFLCFNPKDPHSAPAAIVKKGAIGSYHSVIQTHRVWDRKLGILWKKGSSIYRQIGLAGVDRAGRLLFFYHPNTIDVHELAANIVALDLDLTGLLYLDGGFHGSLYLDSALGRGQNTWISLPNLIGIKPAAD